jgi:hypothetical protein
MQGVRGNCAGISTCQSPGSAFRSLATEACAQQPCQHVHELRNYGCLVRVVFSCAHAAGDRNRNALPAL